VPQCVTVRCSVLQSRECACPTEHVDWSLLFSFAAPLLAPPVDRICVAVCCSVLQCVAVCCSVLQCVAVCCNVLQSRECACPSEQFEDSLLFRTLSFPKVDIIYVAACCSVFQYIAVCCSVLQCVAARFSQQ